MVLRYIYIYIYITIQFGGRVNEIPTDYEVLMKHLTMRSLITVRGIENTVPPPKPTIKCAQLLSNYAKNLSVGCLGLQSSLPRRRCYALAQKNALKTHKSVLNNGEQNMGENNRF